MPSRNLTMALLQNFKAAKQKYVYSSCFGQGVKVVSLFLVEPLTSSPAVLDFLYTTAAPSTSSPSSSSYSSHGLHLTVVTSSEVSCYITVQ